jgi:hypothetical protein
MMLNKASFTLSVMGRVMSPGTASKRIPRAIPPIIRGLLKLAPYPSNESASEQTVSIFPWGVVSKSTQPVLRINLIEPVC